MVTEVNQTNLALKGIIGIQAMAEISRALGNDTDAQTYGVSTLASSTRTFLTGVACRITLQT